MIVAFPLLSNLQTLITGILNWTWYNDLSWGSCLKYQVWVPERLFWYHKGITGKKQHSQGNGKYLSEQWSSIYLKSHTLEITYTDFHKYNSEVYEAKIAAIKSSWLLMVCSEESGYSGFFSDSSFQVIYRYCTVHSNSHYYTIFF